jgi:hypothetical protein
MPINKDHKNNLSKSIVVAGFLINLGRDKKVFLGTGRLACPVFITDFYTCLHPKHQPGTTERVEIAIKRVPGITSDKNNKKKHIIKIKIKLIIKKTYS